MIDVSTPSTPFETGFFDTPGRAFSVASSGSYAYVADWGQALRVIDAGDPAAPSEIGFYDTPGETAEVALAGGYVFVADEYGGVTILRDCHTLFRDGFESGDTAVWSTVVGEQGSK